MIKSLKHIFTVYLIVIGVDSSAQSVEHQTISSAGAFINNGNGSMSVTAGQPITETKKVGFLKRIFTQGFQQSDCIVNPQFTLADNICRNGPSFQLFGEPSSGVFVGAGISGNTFNPSAAGAGVHKIKYLVNKKGCVDSIVKEILVKQHPLVAYNIVDSITCRNGTSIVLNQATPKGGLYFGAGVIDSVFIPSLMNVGKSSIVYSYTDSTNNCSAKDTAYYTVAPNPNVSIATIPLVCPNVDTLSLTYGVPSGGTYSGLNVINGDFIPVSAGSSKLIYSYLDTTNGCHGSATTFIQVDTLPRNLSLNITSAYCENASNSFLSAGFPIGGYYKGLGAALDTFGFIRPTLSVPGIYPIAYTYYSNYGCSKTLIDSLTILSKPPVNISAFNSICSTDTVQTLSIGTPFGGFYTGFGVVNNILNPLLVSPGNSMISYSYTDTNNCSNSDTTTYVVYGPTVPITTFPTYFCVDLDTVNLNSKINVTSVFSGTGIVNNVLNTAGLANQQIKIKHQSINVNNCVFKDSLILTVSPKPAVASNNYSFCNNLDKIKLQGASPKGGIYSGSNVNSTFGDYLPSQAKQGTDSVYYTYADLLGCVSVDTSLVTLFNTTMPSITPVYAVCKNDPVVGLSADISGGIFIGSGILGSKLFPSILIDTLGSIIYSVSDINGCSTFDTVSFKVFDPPVINTSLNQTICKNEEANFDLPQDLIYTWSNGKTGKSVSLNPTVTSNYSLLASDGLCSTSQTFKITVSPTPVVNVTTLEPECNSLGSVSVGVQGNNGPYSYHWSSGHTTPSAQQLTAGIYEVTITDDNNCPSIETVPLSNSDGPLVSIDNLVNPTCFNNNDGSIAVTANITTGGSFTWLDGQTTPTITSLYNGNYQYLATDSSGCLTSGSIKLTAPEKLNISFVSNPISCLNANGQIKSEVIGGTSPYSYLWSDGTLNDSIVNKPVGFYELTVTDANNCLISEATGIASVERIFIKLDSLVFPDCGLSNGAINLKPLFKNYSINWSNGDSTFNINNLDGNNYVATIDDGTCTVKIPIKLPYNATSSPNICQVTIDTSSLEKIVAWEGNGLNQTLYRRFNQNQTYEPVFNTSSNSTVSFTDQHLGTKYFPASYKLETANTCNSIGSHTKASSIYLSAIINLSGTVKLLWQDELKASSSYEVYGKAYNGADYVLIDTVGSPSNSLMLDSLGDYRSFFVSTLNTNCTPNIKVLSNVVDEFSKDLSLSIEDKISINSYNLYPNPTLGKSYLELISSTNQTVVISIYSSIGLLVNNTVVNSIKGYNNYELATEGLAAGTYLVNVKTQKETQSISLIIQ